MDLLVSEGGTIGSDGKLKIFNKDLFLHRISTFPSQNVEIQIIKREGSFTHQQRKYYFSVIVPEIQKALLYYGNNYSKSETDHFLRERFLSFEDFSEETGRFIKKPHRLSDSDSTVGFSQFQRFLEFCIMFAAQELNWAVPYPNEQFRVSDYTDAQILSINSKY